MTDFELSLATALRKEAEEISMSVDQQRAAEELHTRLDQADRRRRRWYIGGTALALAAVVAAIAIVVARPPGKTHSEPPVSPPSSAPADPFTVSSLVPPLSVLVPPWTADASKAGSTAGVANFVEDPACAGLNGESPCADDQDLKLRMLSVRWFFAPGDTVVTKGPTFDAYVAHLAGLESQGIATIADRSSVAVGGRSATVMSLSVLLDAPGAVACARVIDPAVDCMPLVAGRAARIAVVNQGTGNPPTVFYLSLNGDAPDRDERFAEFDAMLETASFG